MSEHTPTPWDAQPEAFDDGDWELVAPFPGLPGEHLYVATTYDMGVEHGGAKANAQFIKLAVNSHIALVSALAQAALQIEYLHGKFCETGSGNHVLARVREALASAGVK